MKTGSYIVFTAPNSSVFLRKSTVGSLIPAFKRANRISLSEIDSALDMQIWSSRYNNVYSQIKADECLPERLYASKFSQE